MSSSRGWIAGGAIAAVVAGLGVAGLAIRESRSKKKERRERRRRERQQQADGGGATRASAETEAPIEWQGVMTPLTEVVRGIRSRDVDTVQQACVVALEQAAHERLRDAMVSVGGIEALVEKLTDEHIVLRFLAARALINYLVKDTVINGLGPSGIRSLMLPVSRAAVAWKPDAEDPPRAEGEEPLFPSPEGELSTETNRDASLLNTWLFECLRGIVNISSLGSLYFLAETGAEMLIDQDAHRPLAVISTIDAAKRSQREALKAIVNLASYEHAARALVPDMYHLIDFLLHLRDTHEDAAPEIVRSVLRALALLCGYESGHEAFQANRLQRLLLHGSITALLHAQGKVSSGQREPSGDDKREVWQDVNRDASAILRSILDHNPDLGEEVSQLVGEDPTEGGE